MNENSGSYYGICRSEIAPLLPAAASRILDVGCGAGATSAWLKSRYPHAHRIGLEGNGALLPMLENNVDEAHILDLNGALPDIGARPGSVSRRARTSARPARRAQGRGGEDGAGGTVLISCPTSPI